MFLLGGPEIPPRCHSGVLLYAVAVVAHGTEVELRVVISLVGRLAEPPHSLGVVLLSTVGFPEHTADAELRLGKSLFARAPQHANFRVHLPLLSLCQRAPRSLHAIYQPHHAQVPPHRLLKELLGAQWQAPRGTSGTLAGCRTSAALPRTPRGTCACTRQRPAGQARGALHRPQVFFRWLHVRWRCLRCRLRRPLLGGYAKLLVPRPSVRRLTGPVAVVCGLAPDARLEDNAVATLGWRGSRHARWPRVRWRPCSSSGSCHSWCRCWWRGPSIILPFSLHRT